MNPGWLCAALLLVLPCAGVTADGAMWNTTQVGEIGYLPLDDIRSFYKLMPIPQPRESTSRAVGNGSVTLVFGPEPRELRIQGIRCVLSHPVKISEKGDLLVSTTDLTKLIDPILRPTYIANRRAVQTVVLDAGHGGHDTGTVTEQVREADVALLVASKLSAELRKRGMEVRLTRSDNRHMSDQSRVDAVSGCAAPIFISLHLNQGRSDTRGAETYTIAPATEGSDSRPGNTHDAANAALSVALQAALVGKAEAKDGGCRRSHYSLLNSLNCPAARVELGYASHTEEAELLNSDEYQNRLALALADGISAFALAMNPDTTLKALPPPPPPPPAEPTKVEAPKKPTPPKKATPRKRKPAPRRSNTRRRK